MAVEYVPAPQLVQFDTVAAPLTADHDPALQLRQMVIDAGSGWYVPARH